MNRLQLRSEGSLNRKRFLSSLLTHLPGAWLSPSTDELVSLYQLRYRMAMQEQKYDIALVFLNKILEVEPGNFEARLCKGQIFHRHTRNLPEAIEQYTKVLRMAPAGDSYREKARSSLTELIATVR
jgi:tetratricopeptide (TPR) repeat protein